MNEGANGAPLVQKDEDAPITYAETYGGGSRQTARPLQRLQRVAESCGTQRVTHNARVHKYRHGERGSGRCHLVAGHDSSAAQQPLGKRRRIRGHRNGRQHTQILRDTNGGTTRRLACAEETILARVKTARAGQLHAGVKVQNYAAAV